MVAVAWQSGSTGKLFNAGRKFTVVTSYLHLRIGGLSYYKVALLILDFDYVVPIS